jgi:hypothetical protein
MLALDGQKHLVHVPLVTGPGTATPELIRILLAKLAAPLPNRFIGHTYAAFEQYFFHIAEAQAEAKVQPHGVTGDLNGKAMVLIAVAWGWGVHDATLLPRVGSNKLTMPTKQREKSSRKTARYYLDREELV